MAIFTSFKTLGSCFLLVTAIIPVSIESIVHAQDAVGNTPPELRDFRLDPPPRETEPVPESPAPVPPPVAPSSADPEPTPTTRPQNPTTALPQRSEPVSAPSVDITSDVRAEPEAVSPIPEATQTPDAATTDISAPAPTEAIAPPEKQGSPITGMVAIVGLLLAIAGGVVFMWRRRQVTPSAATSRTKSAPKRQNPSPPRPARVGAEPVAPTQKPPPVRAMSIAFIPENAVVSFNSLTIRGQLHITNASDSAAGDLALSTLLISASNEQQHSIDRFFATSELIGFTPLGTVQPRENMSLPLQLGVALNEMQTFSLQNRTLVAPILLAKLARRSSDGTVQEVARLVCMIGRESTPPQPRMGPLRLDQGPRSFDRLGQRALLS